MRRHRASWLSATLMAENTDLAFIPSLVTKVTVCHLTGIFLRVVYLVLGLCWKPATKPCPFNDIHKQVA